MDSNQRWRPQDQRYNQQVPSQPAQQNIHYGAAAAESVHNAQGLLAVYPMASATPTNHAVRHISNMYTTAPPPTFVQPSYYTPHTPCPPGNPPPYSEYDQQIRYLSAPHPPTNDGGYWTTARDSAVRILADQPPSSYRYPAQQTWRPPPAPVSSFRTSPFAQSVLQRTAPAPVIYPTHSPPMMQTSSSSLAHALGPPILHPPLPLQPPPHPKPPPHQKVYHPEESKTFFNSFLAQKTREMNASIQAIPASPVKTPVAKLTATATVKPPADESPDPLSVFPHSSPVPITPRKRKPVVEIELPSAKRMQIMRSEYIEPTQIFKSPAPSVPVTPSSKSASSLSSQGPTPTPRRSLNTAYVSVPHSPWLTPSSRKNPFTTPSMSARRQGGSRSNETPGDLGGYGNDDEFDSPFKRRDITDSNRTSARRTGDRDDRAPLEKFLCLVEDIFEAEDNLPSEVVVADLPGYFSALSADCSLPQLHSNHVRKLTKYIGQVARPNKRLRNAAPGAMGTPRAQGRMAEVETQVLSRLLRMLDRAVKAGEDLDPFRYVALSPAASKNSPRKKMTKSKKPDSGSQPPVPKDGGESQLGEGADLRADEGQDRESDAELTQADYEKLTHSLGVGLESILAADCCIALLGSDRLTKQLYSEELITSCLSTVKNQLTKIIYPFVEASSGAAFDLGSNPLLRSVVKENSSTASDHRKQLSELFRALASVLPRINNLVNNEGVAMSDTIIIQAVYIAIGPFFVIENGGDGEVKGRKEKDNMVLRTLGKSAMRGLRLDALALIRSIFANHESQRSWIIEEILTSLIKLSDAKQKAGQFRLRDGRSIRTVSALLLQLVQTSAHDVRLRARKIEKNRQNQLALRRQESFPESQQALAEPFLNENDHEEIVLYKGGLDSAMVAAKTIIGFLTKRSGKGKATKNSNEAEYRTIFDNLIGDLLVVLFWPEWPAAGVLLSMICRYMMSALDEKNANSQIDSNAAKSIALDHLGVIAAKIRTSTLKFQRLTVGGDSKSHPLESMEEVAANQDIEALKRLLKAHRDVATHLAKRSSEDQAYDSAREFSAAILGQELASALQQLQKWIETPELDDDLNIKDTNRLHTFGHKVRSALRDVWKDPPTDVFDIGSQEEVDRIDHLTEEIGTLQTLRSSFNPILNTIVSSLNAPAIFIRTKALRALGQIVTSDPTVLSLPVVRRGIESHLLDSSPAVRDAAVELIGKYMIDSPEVAGDYYQKIADRMADTGLSVRKRVIKLLKSFYGVTQDNNRKIDIATRMVLRMTDEDDTVKELATKTIEELWFPSAAMLPSVLKGKSNSGVRPNDKSANLAKVTVIMGTAAHFKDRQSPLEDLLHKIIAEKSEGEVTALHSRYSEICETLIDGLVDATDLPGFTVINCIRTIYLFSSAYPPVLSGANASTLLPYLKNASTSEELSTTDYLLKIFRVSIPHMPKTAGKFGQELQLALQPMIIKPSGNGGVQILQEAVSCMCVVVQHLTHDFIRLVNLLKSCNGRLQQAIKRPANHQMEGSEVRALLILIFIVALLGEHCNFDQLRTENTALAKDIDMISKGSIVEHIYDTLLQLYEKYDQPALRGRILQCLGFLFRAQPTLMTKERSATIMDAIFASPEEEGKGRLLRIMQEFLVSESEKHSAHMKETAKSKGSKPTNVNMDELVGNTDGFADSGVSSAIVQRYLSQVLEAALSPHSPNQAAAVDVLSFTIKQGLAHPLQSFPVIIALETSPNPTLSNRASALHAILQGKHASLLNTRYVISARASFDYQKKVATSAVKGYRTDPTPIALLQRWYALVREKRPSRQEFLKSLVKVFQENPDYKPTQDDVDFTRYMAENFATFDYKTQEEVITVIKYLTVVLSTTGMQLLEAISPSHLLRQLHAPLEPTTEGPLEPKQTDSNGLDTTRDNKEDPLITFNEASLDKLPLIRSSVIICLVMLLKAHLKSLYSLSEEKCNKFTVGKKSAIGDKPAVRRHDAHISWDRLPYATTPLSTSEDIKTQKTRFLDIWNEDGVTAEPEDDVDFA